MMVSSIFPLEKKISVGGPVDQNKVICDIIIAKSITNQLNNMMTIVLRENTDTYMKPP